jgi:hypothetical protein
MTEPTARDEAVNDRAVRRARCRGERGEGVISTAIAVLIVAFLGVGAFAAFRVVLDATQERAVDCVEQIGATGTSTC